MTKLIHSCPPVEITAHPAFARCTVSHGKLRCYKSLFRIQSIIRGILINTSIDLDNPVIINIQFQSIIAAPSQACTKNVSGFLLWFSVQSQHKRRILIRRVPNSVFILNNLLSVCQPLFLKHIFRSPSSMKMR